MRRRAVQGIVTSATPVVIRAALITVLSEPQFLLRWIWSSGTGNTGWVDDQ
jgi:hypothetical protein